MVKLKVLEMKQCIENPNELKWDKFWEDELKQKEDRGKDWDKAASGFHKRAKKDDYHELLFSKLILGENDSVLEVGPGLGSLTHFISLSNAKYDAVDIDPRMVNFLRVVYQEFPNIQIV